MLASIPSDYKLRWYVLDAIAEAVITYQRVNPKASAEELNDAANDAVETCYRAEHSLVLVA